MRAEFLGILSLMLFLSIVHHYLLWHYSRAYLEIFHVWTNFLWFVSNFFSIVQLAKAWFAPFKRMVEGRGETWNFEDLAAFIVIGLISRIIGAILRTVVIGIGLLALLVTVGIGVVVLALWIVAPVLMFLLVAYGIVLLLT